MVAASKNPDAVECVVPYRVNDDMIFLGPVKTLEKKLLQITFVSYDTWFMIEYR